MSLTLEGNFPDPFKRCVYPVKLTIRHGVIAAVERIGELADPSLPFLLPGFVDAHVHIESSMLVPSEFARLASVHGTVATVSDPHEIANVCGLEGVHYMISNGKSVPFKFFFGAPSCVPATTFESAGAVLDTASVELLLDDPDILYLSEMMNFPGVLSRDPDVLTRICSAVLRGKPVDGHAPGLKGDDASLYIAAGISTDHECFTLEEATDKLAAGMKILIREGSAARNFEALWPLIDDYPGKIMFCSDDKHPDSLVSGHINELCARAISKGCDPFNVIRAACYTPVEHYRLPVGLLRKHDPADLVIVENLQTFNVKKTLVNGVIIADHGKSLIARRKITLINNFNCLAKSKSDFGISVNTNAKTAKVLAIGAIDGQLITEKLPAELPVVSGLIQPDIAGDFLKIAVVNRYREAPVAVAFIHRFGLKTGAIASSVAHDSHNIVVVGTNDIEMAKAVNLLIDCRGGVSCVGNDVEHVLPLPVAGLMSDRDGYEIAEAYTKIDLAAKSLGSTLSSPFMTLSFMALLVIPHLKLSDLGLFDGDSFDFTPTTLPSENS